MSKVLNQDEVDALLRGLSGGEIETEAEAEADDSGVVTFDLANQDRIIRGRMPVLEIINDRFARYATNSLANALRKRVDVNPISIDMSKFGDFMRSLPVPTSINIFKIEPLRGNAILVVDTRLVFALVENFFGGSGSQPKIEGRDFTPIEQTIIHRIVATILSNMEEAWRPVHDVSIEFVRTEINPQFATIVPPSDVVVVVSFEVELENAIGSIILCLPYATIEPIRSKLYASFQSERLEIDHAWIARFKERLMETPIEVVVRLGSTEITGRQLLDLEVGDILLLNSDTEDELLAEVEGIPKFTGSPGNLKGSRGLQGSAGDKDQLLNVEAHMAAEDTKNDMDQDKLAEEWAAALSEQEEDQESPESADGEGEAALADEWASALASQEEESLKKEKEQDYFRSQTKSAEFKDLTQEAKSPRAEGSKRDLDFILDIPLDVSAELGRAKLLINELLQLGQGSVVELNKLAGEPLEIYVNGKLVARGEAVVINEKFGIRLTDIISPIERVKQLG